MGLTARITGAEQERIGECSITFYEIAVFENNNHWTVHKRYSDFHGLDRLLQDTGELTTLRLPTKGLFGLRHRLDIFHFNEERQEGLNAYLLHLCRQVERLEQSPALSGFLGPGAAAMERSCSFRRVGGNHSRPVSPEPEVESPSGILTDASKSMPRRSTTPRVPLLVRPGRSLDFLSSLEWKSFEAAQPALADSMRCCSEILVSNRFENDSEGIFVSLRRALRASMRGSRGNLLKELDLASIPGKDCVWEFLLQFAVRRGFYKAQAAEVIGILEASEAWVEALQEHEELRRLRDLLP